MDRHAGQAAKQVQVLSTDLPTALSPAGICGHYRLVFVTNMKADSGVAVPFYVFSNDVGLFSDVFSLVLADMLKFSGTLITALRVMSSDCSLLLF